MAGKEDGLVHDERPNLRSRQAEYKHKLSQPIPSTKELLELLCSPLDLFGLAPPELCDRGGDFFKGCTIEEKNKILSATTWLSDVQTILLQKTLLDWNDSLKSKGLFEIVLRSWFAPDVKANDEFTRMAACGALHTATLSTISSILSSVHHQTLSESLSSTALKSPLEQVQSPEAISLLYDVITLYGSTFSLRAVVASLQKYQVGAKRDLVWNDVVRDIVALPDRAANATNGHPPLDLQRTNSVKFIANQLGILLQNDCPAKLTSILVSKLHRAGYFQDTIVSTEEPANLWPGIIRNCIKGPKMEWSRLLVDVHPATRGSIASSLVTFVDQYSLKRTSSSTLVTAQELQRPGTEGLLFLSSDAWDSILTIGSVVDIFFEQQDKPTEDSDSDSDSDDGRSVLSGLILPSATSSWSPLTARLLVHLFSKSARPVAVIDLLDNIVDIWSLSSRIKMASWEQEIHYTTVLLLLINEASLEAKSKLRTSSTFINGVSSHLEHLDPKFRRMGMLVAEVVSGAGSADKPLSFGKSMWDGKGEGREEARVLRAMYHGWADREHVPRKTDTAEELTAFGLNGGQDVIKRADVSLPTRERKAPKTRILPHRRPAAPRKRIMIESLGGTDEALSDEHKQDGLLPPLTQVQVRPRYYSESEVSSSSEDDSEDSEGDSMIPNVDEEKKEEFGMGVPQKKRRRPPVYINELSPLFREQEREANKLALKHAERLIERKAGWGGEVDENAIDLAIAIIALNNTFGFKNFEERKKTMLTALICASPRLVAPCLAEQFFNLQYSISQRVCILNAMAFGARKLAEKGEKDSHSGLRTLAEDISQLSMTRSRIQGEQRMPEIQRERSLLINKQTMPLTLDATSWPSLGMQVKNVYLELAAPAFIFPLVNRFHAQLQQHNQLSSRRYKRSGSGILFDPFLISAFLDTLTVLCYCAQNAVNFSTDIVPEVIDLGLAITNMALVKSSIAIEERDEVSSSVLGAAANLFLVLLDTASELDSGRILLRNHIPLVNQVESWAAALFETMDGQGGAGGKRAASGAAAILLCIDKLKQDKM